jgi:hypothetical protein
VGILLTILSFGDFFLMCHVNTGNSWDRPIAFEDIDDICSYYSKLGGVKVPKEFIQTIFQAITSMNSPQPIVLVTIVDLYYRWLNDMKGVYPWATLPFSALNYKSGVRLMAPMMEPFHGVVAMFLLAQRNIQLLRDALEEYGVTFMTFHDCSCFMAGRVEGVMNTQFYQDINLVRSHFEALGGDVEFVPFEAQEWQSPDLDMGEEEIQAYIRMNQCLNTLKPLARESHFATKQVDISMQRVPFGNLVMS